MHSLTARRKYSLANVLANVRQPDRTTPRISDADVHHRQDSALNAVILCIAPLSKARMALVHLDARCTPQAGVSRRHCGTSVSGSRPHRRCSSRYLSVHENFRTASCRRISRDAISPVDAAAAPVQQDPVGLLKSREEPSQTHEATEVSTIPQLWAMLASKHGGLSAVHDPHQKPETKATYRCVSTLQYTVDSARVTASL